MVGGVLLPSGAFAKFPDLGKESSSVVYRTLGNTGLKVSVVSYGVMDAKNPSLINRALELGINHYDTAHGYQRGNNEKMLGEVFQSWGKRKDVVIATKVALPRDSKTKTYNSGATKEAFLEKLDQSLKRLKTDYVDILYSHSVYNESMVNYEEVLEALAAAKKQGKARFVGLSTHSNEHKVIRSVIKNGHYDVVLTSYNFLKSNRKELKEAIKEADQAGIGIVVMKPMATNHDDYSGKRDKKYFESALKWVLSDPHVACAIPGMTAFNHLEQNFSVMKNMKVESRDIHQLAKERSNSWGHYCSFCQQCLPTCPQRVDIPEIMRSLMYHNGYGNPSLASETYAAIDGEQKLGACENCLTCAASCPNGNDIPKALQTARKIFA